MGIFGKVYHNIHHNQQIDDSAKITEQNSIAAKRANEEEVRRKEETILLRQSAALAARKSFTSINPYALANSHGFRPTMSSSFYGHTGSIIHLNKKIGKNDSYYSSSVSNPIVGSLPKSVDTLDV
jgi:hypothetical protein